MVYRTTSESDDRLVDAYFNWLFDIVCDETHRRYRNLLWRLFMLRFIYFIDNDRNRAGDGIYLHHEFSVKTGYPIEDLNDILGGTPEDCSVLEMIIGVAIRIDSIMWDPEKGAQTGTWFWMMMHNLGLDVFQDEDFDEECVEQIDHWMDIFIKRDYRSNGLGGLFPLRNPKSDQRNVEIWYQMQAWCAENFSF